MNINKKIKQGTNVLINGQGFQGWATVKFISQEKTWFLVNEFPGIVFRMGHVWHFSN